MSGLSLLGETKEKLLLELREGRKTAKDLADSLNIQVSAARKHLEALASLNIVGEEFVHNGIGRPKKFYYLTENGYELFPRQYEQLLCGILTKLAAVPGANPEALVKETAREIVGKAQPNKDDNQGNGKVTALVQLLNDFGFDASLEDTGTNLEITSHNCPLHKAALKHQKLVCHCFHDEIIKTALETREVRLAKCITRGDAFCKHVIEKI